MFSLLQVPQVEDSWSKIFDKYANGATKMDAAELTQALNAVLRTSMSTAYVPVLRLLLVLML